MKIKLSALLRLPAFAGAFAQPSNPQASLVSTKFGGNQDKITVTGGERLVNQLLPPSANPRLITQQQPSSRTARQTTKKEPNMKRNFTALLLAFALATPALFAPAQDAAKPRNPLPQDGRGANQPPPEGGRPRAPRPDGPGGQGGVRPPLIAALDANNDGEIDAKEIENAAKALRKLDKNGDGKLTLDEIRPPRPGGPQGPDGQRPPGGQGYNRGGGQGPGRPEGPPPEHRPAPEKE